MKALSKKQLHVVLGGSGAIGSSVIDELKQRNLRIRAVEKTKKVKGVETINANLLNFKDFQKAVNGATHIYLCIGLPYNSKIWLRDWPRVMENTIKVCSNNKAKLIFFDNIYSYGPPPLSVPFSEKHTQNPTTKKGKARKITVNLMIKAMNLNKIKGVIGRSADFYGPFAINSPFYKGFLENILKNKNPVWFGKENIKHTYAYTQDNAKSLVKLALDDSAYGQVWHLPVGKPVSIKEILDIFNKKLNKNFKIRYMPRIILNILSIFIPILREVKEMSYQFDEPYIMSYDKFKKKYPGFNATSYDIGIEQMIKSFSKKSIKK